MANYRSLVCGLKKLSRPEIVKYITVERLQKCHTVLHLKRVWKCDEWAERTHKAVVGEQEFPAIVAEPPIRMMTQSDMITPFCRMTSNNMMPAEFNWRCLCRAQSFWSAVRRWRPSTSGLVIPGVSTFMLATFLNIASHSVGYSRRSSIVVTRRLPRFYSNSSF